jgi:hypothetical protein
VSVTARRVAAHRLTFDRIPAAYGDPVADEALARDVAGAAGVAPGPKARGERELEAEESHGPDQDEAHDRARHEQRAPPNEIASHAVDVGRRFTVQSRAG